MGVGFGSFCHPDTKENQGWDDDANADAAQLWLGVDLGATSVKVGVVTGEGKLLATSSEPHKTEKDEKAVVSRIAACCRKALEKAGKRLSDIEGVGVGSPGGIKNGIVTSASNFPSWRDVPLARMISMELSMGNRPVILNNDADAATCGELWVGAAASLGHSEGGRGNGIQNMVLLTLGTGIGAGVIINGQLLSGATGTIEGGHHIVQKDGKQCPCGQKGCLEMYCSAPSIVAMANDVIGGLSEEEARATVLCEKKELSCREIFEAALKSDNVALKIVDKVASYLAIGCINFMRILDPAALVITGGVVEGDSGTLLLKHLKNHVAKSTWTCLPTPTHILIASSGRHSGIFGAVAAARMMALDQKGRVT